MLSQKLLETIDHSFIGKMVERKAQLWGKLNPDKFYVENIRSFYNLPHSVAKLLCDMAVKMGVFEKEFEIICPKHSVIGTFENIKDIPEFIECENCIYLEEDNSQIRTSENIMPFYKLANN